MQRQTIVHGVASLTLFEGYHIAPILHGSIVDRERSGCTGRRNLVVIDAVEIEIRRRVALDHDGARTQRRRGAGHDKRIRQCKRIDRESAVAVIRDVVRKHAAAISQRDTDGLSNGTAGGVGSAIVAYIGKVRCRPSKRHSQTRTVAGKRCVSGDVVGRVAVGRIGNREGHGGRLTLAGIGDIQDVVGESPGGNLRIDDVVFQVADQQAVGRVAGLAGFVRLRQPDVIAVCVG